MAQVGLSGPLKRESPSFAEEQRPEKRRRDSAPEEASRPSEKDGRKEAAVNLPRSSDGARHGERTKHSRHREKLHLEGRESDRSGRHHEKSDKRRSKLEGSQASEPRNARAVSAGASSKEGKEASSSLRPAGSVTGPGSGPADDEWYYKGQDKVCGPYSLDQLIDGLENKTLFSALPVFKKRGTGYWPAVKLQDLLEGNVDLEAMEERKGSDSGGGLAEGGVKERGAATPSTANGAVEGRRVIAETEAAEMLEHGSVSKESGRSARTAGRPTEARVREGLQSTPEPQTKHGGAPVLAEGKPGDKVERDSSKERAESRSKVRVDFKKTGGSLKKAPVLSAFAAEEEEPTPCLPSRSPPQLVPESSGKASIAGSQQANGRSTSEAQRASSPPARWSELPSQRKDALQQKTTSEGAPRGSRRQTREEPPPKESLQPKTVHQGRGHVEKANESSGGSNKRARERAASPVPQKAPVVNAVLHAPAAKSNPKTAAVDPSPAQPKPAAQTGTQKVTTPVKLPIVVQTKSAASLGPPPSHLSQLQQAAVGYAAAHAARPHPFQSAPNPQWSHWGPSDWQHSRLQAWQGPYSHYQQPQPNWQSQGTGLPAWRQGHPGPQGLHWKGDPSQPHVWPSGYPPQPVLMTKDQVEFRRMSSKLHQSRPETPLFFPFLALVGS
jgi:hypothetical protein